MVFTQSEQSSPHMSEQFGCEQRRHAVYDEQHLLVAQESACKAAIPTKSSPSDEVSKSFSNCHKDFVVVNATPGDNSHRDLCGNPNLSWGMGNNCEVFWLVNGKRSLHGEPCLRTSKRLKEDQNMPFGSHEVRGQELPSAYAELGCQRTAAIAENTGSQGTNSNCLARTDERETSLNPPVWVSSYSTYIELTCQETKFDEGKVMNLPIGYFNRKHVAIGAHHQADVPECVSCEFKDDNEDYRHFGSPLINSSSNHPIVEDGYSDEWAGTCLMPMPGSSSLASDAADLNLKVECRCLDEGSIRCVRQHVMEARDKLRQNLGLDRFLELGFGDMGEVVAQEWTEKEEELFHKVVLTNPASLGMNFWNLLARVFPTRCSKELVSYYYNVFMLRKRAAQNRSDPLHVDSDNDEWQDSDDGEFLMDDEEDDEENSAVESPLADEDEVAGEPDRGEEEITEEADDFECNECTFAGSNEKEHEIQDDSCTSFEGQDSRADSCGHVGIFDLQGDLTEDRLSYRKNNQDVGLSDLTDNELYDNHCDSKDWEMNYSKVQPALPAEPIAVSSSSRKAMLAFVNNLKGVLSPL